MGRISERLKHDTQALLDGYKPAIISERGKSYEDLKKRYPYICPFVRSEPDSLILFQTNSHKKRYLERMKKVAEGSPEFEYVLGTTLGFPDQSAKWFASMSMEEDPPEKKWYGVGIYWAGFTFMSHIEYVDQEIQKLWNTYDHPKANENSLFLLAKGKGFTEISYGSMKQVKKIQKEIMLTRNLMPITN